MAHSAKDIRIAPIAAADGNAFVRRVHYSGKVDTRTQLHLGVFLNGRLEGAMQFGPSLDKRKSIGLVANTEWNGFIDLHRLAFTDRLPRNSESRALSVAMRFLRRNAPHLKWVLSYADATQCGDGTIYRAAGFVLTNVKRNTSMFRLPDGTVHCKIVFEPGFSGSISAGVKGRYGKTGSESAGVFLRKIGAVQLPGFQLRYIYFLDPTARERLTVPVLPFARIAEMGAGMYRGKTCAKSIVADAPAIHAGEGGSVPTLALHIPTGSKEANT